MAFPGMPPRPEIMSAFDSWLRWALFAMNTAILVLLLVIATKVWSQDNNSEVRINRRVSCAVADALNKSTQLRVTVEVPECTPSP